MDSEDDVEYAPMARLEVLLAAPPLATNSSDDSMIEDPLETNSTDEDYVKILVRMQRVSMGLNALSM